jgi:cell division septation protein DedD
MTFYVSDEDRFWQEPQPREWIQFRGSVRFVVFLLLLVGFVVGAWYIFHCFRGTPNPAELPLIRADDSPYKMKAEDKGVPGINHQDKLVYGRIRNDEQAPPIEHILPDPESPTALGQLKEAPETVQMVEQYIPEDVMLEKVAEISSEPAKQTAPSIDSIEALIEKAAPAEKAASVEKPVPAKKGKILIQLGSLKSHDLAEAEWSRVSKKHKDILGGFEPKIQKVDLGEEKGIYHRLRTGPFETVEKAQAACTSLKEKKVECRVISQ